MNEDEKKRKRQEYLMYIKQLLTSYVGGKVGEQAIIQAANAMGVDLDNGMFGMIVKKMGEGLGESVPIIQIINQKQLDKILLLMDYQVYICFENQLQILF
jgi:hypothetical protein